MDDLELKGEEKREKTEGRREKEKREEERGN